MKKSCAHRPADPRAFGQAVGNELLRRHGKQRHYATERVRAVVDSLGFPADTACWAQALYASPADFEQLHRATGETCDYAAMKAEMFDAMTGTSSASWFDADLSWLDWPDFNFADVFSFFDF